MSHPPAGKQPSDYYPALTWERLKGVAQIAYRWAYFVAKRALSDESGPSVGLQRWDLIRVNIIKAFRLYPEWLSPLDKGNVFSFAVGMVPTRFCRLDANVLVPPKYATPTRAERDQFELLHEADGSPLPDLVFRLLVLTDAAGRYPVAIYFAAANVAGELVHSWQIPVDAIDEDGTEIAPIASPKAPIPLPPLEIQIMAEVEAEADRAQEEAEAERRATEQAKRDAEKRGADTKGA